jgi:hypothetical protein
MSAAPTIPPATIQSSCTLSLPWRRATRLADHNATMTPRITKTLWE